MLSPGLTLNADVQMVVERSHTDSQPVFLSTHIPPSSSPGSPDGPFLSPMTPSQLDASFGRKAA